MLNTKNNTQNFSFPSADLKDKIRQTVYLKYLRDVVFVGLVEDSTDLTLSSMIMGNQDTISKAILGHETWLKDLYVTRRGKKTAIGNSRNVNAIIDLVCSVNNMKITVSVAEMRDQVAFLMELSDMLQSQVLSNILFHA